MIAQLEAAGWQVKLRTQGGGLSVREICGAHAVVIDLSRLPSHGRAVAAWLRGAKSTRNIPIVFVNGDPEKVERVKQELPDAIYSTTHAVTSALKRAMRKPLSKPVVPKGMMDGSGRTTAQKLGIQEGAKVLIIDPPSNYAMVLGALPASVEFVEGTDDACSVALWFVRNADEYAAGLRAKVALAGRSKFWVIWKKGQEDFNGNNVREIALVLGLVDYKICSLDAVWTGMALAVRKAKN